jgi:uncharacterized delta-60 repeat protein
MTKLALGFVALIACGDNTNPTPLNPDSSEPTPDSPPDSPPDGPSFVVPTPFAVPLSAAGPDQLQSAAPGPDGSFYAAGFAAQTTTSTRFVTVVRHLPTGAPDAAFGANGVVTTPLEFSGGAGEVGLAIQADGKILVSGTTPSPTITGDRDIGIVRLDTNGTLDATFGTAGVAVINLNDAIMAGTTPTGADASRGLAVSAAGIFLHGVSRGVGKKSADATADRTDTDYTVVKLLANGTVDTAGFGGQSITLGAGFTHTADTKPGQFRLDIQETGATARGLKVLADGKLMASGYTSTPSVGNTVQPVLIKLNANGTLDTTWGADAQGVFHDVVIAVQTEIYSIALHADGTFTTAGYGRAAGDINDFISLRFDADPASGANVRDLTYNNATNGALVFDPSGAMLGSNCRNALALPNGKTLLMGSTGPSNMPAQDAVAAFVDDAGQLDTAYGDGVHVFKLGADGNDQFWGAAISGTKALVVGYQGGGAANAQTETTNDDAFAVIFDLQ